MRSKECIAMLLAGGKGSGLGVLTKRLANPALPYGGKYRIIDFSLSNCINSGIDTVGVLTQYRPLELNTYIGIGQAWDLDRLHGGVTVLPPHDKGKSVEWRNGTAGAIAQNIEYVDEFSPEYVLVLSGDHIYKMDYSEMLEYHKSRNAEVTIASKEVLIEEAKRFGIMQADENGRIYNFIEKPEKPLGTKASMGVYIFSWKLLKKYLLEDNKLPDSSHDFSRSIIPKMLADKKALYDYPFNGYWKDVGTIKSLWEANMDLLEDVPEFELEDSKWRIYSKTPALPPHYLSSEAKIKRSIISEGCNIYGSVDHSVIFAGVHIGKGSSIKNSIIMSDVSIEDNVIIENSIVAEGTIVENNCRIGVTDISSVSEPELSNDENITVIGEFIKIPEGMIIEKNKMVDETTDGITLLLSN